MKIALIGYGKMGHAVEKIALERGHSIVCHIDQGEEALMDTPEFRSADVAIEFTTPATAVDNYRRCLAAGVPLVSGTTGWLSRRAEGEKMVADSGLAMFWTSNFSIGVSLFQEICRRAENVMKDYPEYTPCLSEIHHVHKLDHPSGTAVTTAENLIKASEGRLTAWTEDPAEYNADHSRLLVNHERIGEVPGTHTVIWTSAVDTISLEHRAFSREGFAFGAVRAAEWLVAADRKGMFSMPDLLGF